MSFQLPPFARSSEPWTPTEAEIVLSALAGSGLSIHEFGEQHQIHPTRLRRWHTRLGLPIPVVATTDAAPRESTRLVELVARRTPTTAASPTVSAPPPAPMAAIIEVRTPNGWQLRVPGARLAELVHALSSGRC